jgi:hypothetical protein
MLCYFTVINIVFSFLVWVDVYCSAGWYNTILHCDIWVNTHILRILNDFNNFKHFKIIF